ncbi:hypothetical protein [uncultured Dokdonia sp.]|uniref:hypothetical protein n=1 Tax=uncultured Dokdonia sp. TaxID=575653 RepID=UPI002613BF3B|nr:hypothetical protein [uncultured Dokdonia sp.]
MIKKIIIAVMLVMAGNAFGQEGGTASPYSFFGIGTQQFRGTYENRAMGGMGIYSDSLHLNLLNPAQLGRLRFVTFTVGGSHTEEVLKDGVAESNTSKSTIDYLALSFPVSKKAGVSFGLVPYTSVGYDLSDSDEETINTFSGRGGVNRVFLSAGYELTKGLYLGASANYNFGNIQNETLRTIDGAELGTRERNRSDILGFTFELGAQYDVMVTDKLELRSSVKYVPATKVRSENERQVSSVLFNSLGLLQDLDIVEVPVGDTDFDFPSSVTLGAGLGAPNKWFFGAEYTTQKNSTFTNRGFEIDNARFEDAAQFRLGGFYIPKYNSVSSYFERVTYRAGFRYEESGIVIDNEDINEFGISFGVGLPAGRRLSNINFTFEFGQRGTTNSGLVQENFFNAGVSLSLNDIWFIQSKFN